MTLTRSHRAYFKAAKAMSELSDFWQTQIGCVVVYKHKIISSASNSSKTNPVQKRYNKYRFDGDTGKHQLHAEVQALLPLLNRKDIDFSRVSLYIYRQYKNHDLAMARPCPSCMALISDLGIKTLYYSGNNSYISETLI